MCINLANWMQDAAVCEVFMREQLTEECRTPCPGECVLTVWTSWGPCHRPCHLDVGQRLSSLIIIN